MPMKYNKGEWSELYAFIKLLKDGRIYTADKDVNRIDDQFLPIIKIIREETRGTKLDYYTGEEIILYKNGEYIATVTTEDFEENIGEIYRAISDDSNGESTFEIQTIQPFLNSLRITKVKADSRDKQDINMQIHDSNTGMEPEVGYSIKSDIGNPPTLLNTGKNTNFRYRIIGLSDSDMDRINAVDKSVCREYIKQRIKLLLELSESIEFDAVKNETYDDNLILIDTNLPSIYGNMILTHYKYIDEGIYDCDSLVDIVARENPLNYRRTDIYAVKFKKFLTAVALGMTPGRVWDGRESATGGYIIVKRNGDVLCYHLYNRNFFEDYLLSNTRFDRPSASKHDFGYVYKLDGEKYIDLNIQIRFKPIR